MTEMGDGRTKAFGRIISASDPFPRCYCEHFRKSWYKVGTSSRSELVSCEGSGVTLDLSQSLPCLLGFSNPHRGTWQAVGTWKGAAVWADCSVAVCRLRNPRIQGGNRPERDILELGKFSVSQCWETSQWGVRHLDG